MKQLSRDRVIAIMDMLESIKDISDIGYNMQINKYVGSGELYVSACVNIEMTSDNSSKYISCIQDCNKKMEDIEFENIRLTSCNDNDGKSRAFIYGTISIQ